RRHRDVTCRTRTLPRAQAQRSCRSHAPRGQGMQDVDRPAQVQALAQPGRALRPRVESESLRVVPRPEGLGRIGGYRLRRRYLGQGPAVRPAELERVVGLVLTLVAALLARAEVAVRQQGEVR